MSAEELNNLILDSDRVPTERQLETEQFYSDIVLGRRLSFERPYPPEVCLLRIDGVDFLAKGDLSAVKAKQKSGKTAALCIMMAALLSGRWGRLEAVSEGCKMVYLDTEQKPQDTQQVYRRIVGLARRPEQDDYDRLQLYTLRTLDPQVMLRALEEIIRRERPDIVFIDGIVDLVANFNEVEGSQQLIHELLRLASADVTGQDTAIVCVLHTNKADEDHNMRGHLGTMLSQKSGNVLECTKQGDLFCVRNADSRHRPVPQWTFTYDREGQLVDGDEEFKRYREEARALRQQMAVQREAQRANKKLEVALAIISEAGGRIQRTILRDKYGKAMKIKESAATTQIGKWIKKGELFSLNNIITVEKQQEQSLNFSDSDDSS